VQRDGDLAVVSLAQRTGVLPRDTHRVTALLGKAGVVDDDHSSRIGQRLCQQLPIRAQDRLLVPAALIDEQLQRLLGVAMPARYADALTQRLDAFALAVQEQALEVELCPMAAGDDPKSAANWATYSSTRSTTSASNSTTGVRPTSPDYRLTGTLPVVPLDITDATNITSRRSSI
jgi:hypothetical protein